MKTAKELTKVAQDARELKYKRLQEEAEIFCETISEEMERAAEAGVNKYVAFIPKNILPLVRDILNENGYDVYSSSGDYAISWPIV
jgi:hypothetical protein